MLEQILAHFYIANILLTPMVWFAFWQLNPVPLLMVFYSPRLYKKKWPKNKELLLYIIYQVLMNHIPLFSPIFIDFQNSCHRLSRYFSLLSLWLYNSRLWYFLACFWKALACFLFHIRQHCSASTFLDFQAFPQKSRKIVKKITFPEFLSSPLTYPKMELVKGSLFVLLL